MSTTTGLRVVTNSPSGQLFAAAGAVSNFSLFGKWRDGRAVLWLLQPNADPLPLRKIAGLLHCDPSNVTLLSTKLERQGLAERRPHPRDGRVRTLVLTEAGEEVRERLLNTVMRHSPLGGLTIEEQRQLHALLAKAIDNG
ncbi:MarR family transcriptional regulator [Lentzea sp. BCCO 10_0061]|uniref:MarR family transcriptional regulator n=1 Tax=Lentzea sokolovensis TaxID=3095429 RepID=A0ABU4UQ43_9PSEU|nr:MarR family transcriptional regulator [Lentzea sp. BCCO 10_0061]MDX8141612.1 MarR family transcriptional regulator [Lentzea sp. BCCO 10_0061]